MYISEINEIHEGINQLLNSADKINRKDVKSLRMTYEGDLAIVEQKDLEKILGRVYKSKLNRLGYRTVNSGSRWYFAYKKDVENNLIENYKQKQLEEKLAKLDIDPEHISYDQIFDKINFDKYGIYTGEDLFNILPKTVINLDEKTKINVCVINNAPVQPKIPFYCCGAYIINNKYKGSTIDLRRRITQHRTGNSSSLKEMIISIDIFITSNIDDAKLLEKYFTCGPELYTKLKNKNLDIRNKNIITTKYSCYDKPSDTIKNIISSDTIKNIIPSDIDITISNFVGC